LEKGSVEKYLLCHGDRVHVLVFEDGHTLEIIDIKEKIVYIKNEEKYYKDQKEDTVKKFHILLTIVWHIVSCEGYGVILYIEEIMQIIPTIILILL